MKNFIYNLLSNLTSYVAPTETKAPIHTVKIKSPLSFNNKLVIRAINDILINADKKELKAIRLTYVPNEANTIEETIIKSDITKYSNNNEI